MRKFINRIQELDFLNKKFVSKSAEFLIFYGRRRIGKTELLLHFCEKKHYLYFIGRLESKEDTIRRLNGLLIERFNDSRLLNSPLPNLDAFFDYLNEKKEKLILVLDEFPFIVERFPEILSILQDKWDSKLKESLLLIILSGSSVSMMEKYALDYKSPLYGRRTGQWKVEKIDIKHLSKFFPKFSIEEIIKTYSCLDSIPGYLVKFSDELSFEENLKQRILSKGEFLYEEIEILLREEFRDPSNYMSIISAIAGGLSTFNEIYNRSQLDKSLLSKYLHVLENVGIIERIIPITESYKSQLKSRGALYKIKDNFFDFWFRFVYLNKQELEKGNVNGVFENMKKDLELYISRKFEDFCREFLRLEKFEDYNSIGLWWEKDKEIDIVGLDKNKILFGECKWQEKLDPEKIIIGLLEKSNLVEWGQKNRKEHFIIFAKSFKKKINTYNGKSVYCFDLKDLEKALIE